MPPSNNVAAGSDFGAIQPDRAAFDAGLAAGRAQLVWTRIVADTETPVSAMLKLGAAESGSFLPG